MEISTEFVINLVEEVKQFRSEIHGYACDRFRYCIPSNNIRGYYKFFPFFGAEMIRVRRLLQGAHY